MDQVSIAILPGGDRQGLEEAVRAGGGTVVDDAAQADGVITPLTCDPQLVEDAVRGADRVRWVQLPFAGIDAFRPHLIEREGLTWTSGKGVYAAPVAEHALALALALLRDLPGRAQASSWGEPGGRMLHGMSAVVIGAGGIGRRIMQGLALFDARVTAVRRTDAPVEEAARTVTAQQLDQVLPEAELVIVAAALTDGTRGLLDARRIGLMRSDAVLVNIARGGLVDTDAVAQALADGRLAGAGLDVTDPEPLPDGHPLWGEPRALVTPHTADTVPMMRPIYLELVERNVRALAQDGPLEGVVDPEQGY